MSPTSPSKKNYLTFILTVGIPLLVLFIFAKDFRQLEALIRGAGIWGPLFSILLFFLFGFTPLPAEPLAIMNGVIFGPVVGSLITMVGNTLAALAEYWVGRRIGLVANVEQKLRNLPFGLSKFSPNSLWFLLIVRALPQVGAKVVGFTAGIYKVPLLRFVWTALLVNSLGALVFALTGYGLVHWR